MLGQKLAELRKKLGLSQYELASRLGISRGKLANYEQGSRQPDYEMLEQLADYFGVTTDFLLGRSKTQIEKEEEEFQAFANDPDLERWYRKLPESEEEDLQKLRRMWEIIKSDKNNN